MSPTEPVSLGDASRWWRYVKGADWRHPGSDLTARENLPVVHVDREDAAAYARGAGGFLPNVEQWERAARADQSTAREPTGWAFAAGGKPRANVWEGVFP